MRFFYILLSVGIIFYILFQDYQYQNDLVSLSFLFICIWSLFAIFNKRNISYSLYKTFYTFVLLFFGIAPFLQFSDGIVFWKNESAYKAQDYIFTNFIIIFILLFFELTYSFVYRLPTKNNISKAYDNKITPRARFFLLLISLISLYLTFDSNNYNISSLFFRGADFLFSKEEVDPFDQIVNNFFRPISLLIFLIYYTKNGFDFFGLLLLVIGLFCNFPTGLARYNAAALYIPFVLVVFPKIRLKHNFNLIMVFAFLVVFPFLNNFRNYSQNSKLKIGFDFEMFKEGHFDSYSSLLRVMKFGLTTNGEQLLGVLFFWIPRSIWNQKPIGSGAFMADKLGFYFSNVAMNFFGEGYINFGVFGILIFTVALAGVAAFLDKKFLVETYKRKNDPKQLFFFIMVGFMIFILRGDLLSSIAYLIGFLLAAKFILLLLRKA